MAGRSAQSAIECCGTIAGVGAGEGAGAGAGGGAGRVGAQAAAKIRPLAAIIVPAMAQHRRMARAASEFRSESVRSTIGGESELRLGVMGRLCEAFPACSSANRPERHFLPIEHD